MAVHYENATMGMEGGNETGLLKARLGEVYSSDPTAHKNIMITRDGHEDFVQVTFHRTVRVPDNEITYQLPPDLGEFPLYSVQDYGETFPREMITKGTIFFPMYQREAMWMSFKADSPFAIKIYVGGINAISGEARVETLATISRRQKLMKSEMSIQDYLVAGPSNEHQEWIDGIAKLDGSVSQFVAMPLGLGYTVEAQISGLESFGGLQIEGALLHLVLRLQGGGFNSPEVVQAINKAREKEAAEMGIAAGGTIEQVILRDYHPADMWDRDGIILFNVQILNASVFSSITGLPAPTTPVDATTYARLGYPFFNLYDEPTGIFGQFHGVQTVAEKDAETGGNLRSAQDDPNIRFPTIILDGRPRPTGFRPVAEMEAFIRDYDLAEQNRWSALGLGSFRT